MTEYQARGVVHFHAVIRLDAPGDDYQPPPARFTTTLLCDAIAQAAAAVDRLSRPGRPPELARAAPCGSAPRSTASRSARGDGLPAPGASSSVQAVGNYIAKYATKALDAPGLPQQPLRSSQDIAALRCHRHYQAMITTAWQLGGGKLAPARTRLCKWAHTLGHGGHFLTKSRRYSVTFGQLRRARTEHRKRQRHPDGERDPWGRPLDDTVVLILQTGATRAPATPPPPAAELALASAARARDHDRPTSPPEPNRPDEKEDRCAPDPDPSSGNLSGKVLYRVTEAMTVLSMSRSVIYEEIRSGRLRSVKRGRSRLISASAIADYVALLEQERGPPDDCQAQPW